MYVGKAGRNDVDAQGPANLADYLDRVKAWPLREYIPFAPEVDDHVEHPEACREMMCAAVPDDDINYTVISLLLLEEYGPHFTTADVGRAWLRYLPGAMVFTAEREAYAKLLASAGMRFPSGAEPTMDLEECSDNPYNDWIGAQIRGFVWMGKSRQSRPGCEHGSPRRLVKPPW